ncbi:transposase [Streptomyces sp. NPDC088760]|uniref:transposase n=1 Tax=Streptomyces sp. NPDC088760 TaxID=3365890 RepID=UPI0038021CB9
MGQSDAEWPFVEPLLPRRERSRRRLDDRTVLNGVVWKLRTGTAWAGRARGVRILGHAAHPLPPLGQGRHLAGYTSNAVRLAARSGRTRGRSGHRVGPGRCTPRSRVGRTHQRRHQPPKDVSSCERGETADRRTAAQLPKTCHSDANTDQTSASWRTPR